MDQINLQSVYDKLIKEGQEEAAIELLHNYFTKTCANIYDNLMNEEVHVHVHQEDETPVLANEDEGDEEPWNDGVGNWFKGTDQHGHPKPYDHPGDVIQDDTDENLSPINGSQDMDVDGDTVVDDDAIDADDDVGLEDEVEDLKNEVEELKAQLKAQLDFDPEEDPGEEEEVVAVSDDDDDGSNEDEKEEDEVEEGNADDEEDKFDDLEESFELERVNDPHLDGYKTIGSDNEKFNRNDRSPIPNNSPDDRVGGEPVEIRAEEYDGVDRQPSPEVKQVPLRKNQVKNAADDLESVGSKGPKDALLNKERELFPDDNKSKSPIGAGAFDLRGKALKR